MHLSRPFAGFGREERTKARSTCDAGEGGARGTTLTRLASLAALVRFAAQAREERERWVYVQTRCVSCVDGWNRSSGDSNRAESPSAWWRRRKTSSTWRFAARP